MRGFRLLFRFSLVALLLATAAAEQKDAAPRHLIYLHGRIVQTQQSRRPEHPEHGFYELDQILGAFRNRGFVVSGELRPVSATVSESADRVVEAVRKLLTAGVPADRITVVGASMGAAITLLASSRLQHADVRYAVLGPCLAESARSLEVEEGRPPAGHVLSIREESDQPEGPCKPWDAAASTGTALVAKEIVLRTGLRHGFLYRPLPEWVDPVAAWASAQ